MENAELYSSQDEKDNNQEIHIKNEPYSDENRLKMAKVLIE